MQTEPGFNIRDQQFPDPEDNTELQTNLYIVII
jgi:hypothetical protein